MLEIKFEDKYSDAYGFYQDLVIIHNGDEIARESDCGEPEDSKFCRDLWWVAPLLKKVYELGYQDRQREVSKAAKNTIEKMKKSSYMCPDCSEAYMYCACSDNPLNRK